ncbi:hypothetical protein BJV74DRAFT_858329 [Russula compacta]|nr:hypothetical protein BJV74DRAFT_858329 [Russula compacta]
MIIGSFFSATLVTLVYRVGLGLRSHLPTVRSPLDGCQRLAVTVLVSILLFPPVLDWPC